LGRSFHSTKELASSEKQNEKKENAQQNEQNENGQQKDTDKEKTESESQSEQEQQEQKEQPPEKQPISKFRIFMICLGVGAFGSAVLFLSHPFDDFPELQEVDPEMGLSPGGHIYWLDRVWFDLQNRFIWNKYRLLPPAEYPVYTIILDTTDMFHFSGDLTDVGARVWLRPFIAEFIGHLKEEVELIMWSSHQDPDVMDRMLELFDETFSAAFGPDESYRLGLHVYKDLEKLNRPLTHTILISSDPEYGVFQPDNTILIPEYLGEKDDETFQQLLELIQGICMLYPAGRYDIRNVININYSWKNPLESHEKSSKRTRNLLLRELLDTFVAKEKDDDPEYYYDDEIEIWGSRPEGVTTP